MFPWIIHVCQTMFVCLFIGGVIVWYISGPVQVVMLSIWCVFSSFIGWWILAQWCLHSLSVWSLSDDWIRTVGEIAFLIYFVCNSILSLNGIAVILCHGWSDPSQLYFGWLYSVVIVLSCLPVHCLCSLGSNHSERYCCNILRCCWWCLFVWWGECVAMIGIVIYFFESCIFLYPDWMHCRR